MIFGLWVLIFMMELRVVRVMIFRLRVLIFIKDLGFRGLMKLAVSRGAEGSFDGGFSF